MVVYRASAQQLPRWLKGLYELRGVSLYTTSPNRIEGDDDDSDNDDHHHHDSDNDDDYDDTDEVKMMIAIVIMINDTLSSQPASLPTNLSIHPTIQPIQPSTYPSQYLPLRWKVGIVVELREISTVDATISTLLYLCRYETIEKEQPQETYQWCRIV